MKDATLHKARDFALDLAEKAARISRAIIEPPAFERKADTSPVTETDRRIQRLIVEAVAAEYPDHAFLGEEDLTDGPALPAPEKAPYCWVVDPLDGTRNFTHGFPAICTSIALMQNNRTVVGVIYDHASGWHCSAVLGHGALCNGRPARVARGRTDRDILIAVPTGRNLPTLPVIKTFLETYVLRNVGATALHMAYVAAGAVDAAFCYECKLWDIAAGALLITEAGGRISDLSGMPYEMPNPANYAGENAPFFAAAPATFDKLINEITR